MFEFETMRNVTVITRNDGNVTRDNITRYAQWCAEKLRGFMRKLREILIQIIFFWENPHSVTYDTHAKAGLP